MVRPDKGLFEMLMEENLHRFKVTQREDPRNLLLNIAKVTISYKYDSRFKGSGTQSQA